MNYASVMNFIEKIISFMSLLASIVFNDSFGVPKVFFELSIDVDKVGSVLNLEQRELSL